MSILSGKYHLSKRETVGILDDFYGVELGLGSVPKLEKRTSAAIAPAVEEARAYVCTQPVANQDETGWREGCKKAWLWVLATQSVSVFLVDLHRSAEVAKAMIGVDFKGILITDRWSAYNWLENRYRQLCWSHLQRDFQAFVERGGDSETLGEALLTFTHQMFSELSCLKDNGSGTAKMGDCLKYNGSESQRYWEHPNFHSDIVGVP